MKKTLILLIAVMGLGAFASAQDPAPAQEAKTPPETIKFENTGKMPPVEFPHALHGKKNACKDCHEGEKPLFAQKIGSLNVKMAEMYKGQACGACHNGKKAFAAKASCTKCHKKPAAASSK